jgi:cytochrome P450
MMFDRALLEPLISSCSVSLYESKIMSTTTQLPPGPDALPFFGNLLEFQRDQLSFVQRMQRMYGDIVTIYAGNKPFVLLFRPEYVRYLLTEHPRDFIPTQSAGGDLMEVLGEGLLTIEGEAHRQQRRLIQPAFHKKRVESYADYMVQYTQEMLATWQNGAVIDIAEAMQQLTLRIVARSLFGLEMVDQINEMGRHFTQMIEHRRSLLARLLNIYVDLPFTLYGKRMSAKRRIDAFIYKLIEQRRAEGEDRGDVLSMLLATRDDEHPLSNQQIRDHVMTFMAAGHETTANALNWTFYLLARNPEPREKLLHELQTVLAGRAPTLNDLANLPYTEWVINEAMRVYPPVWMMGRHSLVPFEMGGYHFPAGMTVLFSQWVIHHHPDLWQDPETFRPERWDPVNGEKVQPWSYFPFGGGPRICIGMPFAQLEAKLLLATIMQRYTPRLVPGFPVVPKPRVTLRLKHGLRMLLEPTPTIVKDQATVV